MRISDWSSDVCSSDLLAAALVVLVPAAQWKYAASVSPPINDIATDLEDPPLFQAMPRPGAYPGGDTATQQQAAYPDLQPLSLDLAPERAFALARTPVEDRGWAIVAAEPGEGHIHAVAPTRSEERRAGKEGGSTGKY